MGIQIACNFYDPVELVGWTWLYLGYKAGDRAWTTAAHEITEAGHDQLRAGSLCNVSVVLRVAG